MSKRIVKMNFLLMFIFAMAPIDAKSDIRRKLNNILRTGYGDILGAPVHPEDLPSAEPILPGHTLLRPALGMLKSSIKYPQRNYKGSPVYGNPDNIGLKYGGKNEYIMYSSFRRDTRNLKGSAGHLLDFVLDAVQKVSEQEYGQPHPEVLVAVEEPTSEELKPPNLQLHLSPLSSDTENSLEVLEEENAAPEVLDYISDLSQVKPGTDYRRKRKHKDSDSTSSSASFEKNPGNPYTLYKDRYRVNFPWNFNMDGDHMNVNSYAPAFSAGPSGGDIFFARKWWYFNQDDFVPF